jgi:hypothetical protein
MSKKLVVKLNNSQLISLESKKAFIERSYYLNAKIDKCLIKKSIIYFFFTEKIKYKDKFTLKKLIKKLISRVDNSHKEIKTNIIYENDVKFNEIKNFFFKLEKSNQIKKISAGIYTIQGQFLKNFEQLDAFLKSYAKINKYKNIYSHNIVPLESMFLNGYLSNFAHHAMFCSHIERDIISLDQISNLKTLDKNFIKKRLSKPNLILSPTVCHHCFETFRDKTIKGNVFFNIRSSCNRYESKNYKTFERLQSFTMREYVAFGDINFVNNFLNKNLNFFKKKFVKLKIKFRIISASDAFFSENGMKRMIFQNLNSLKKEIQFWLPNEKKWLAVGSFNNHNDTLTKKYNIRNYSKKTIYSACIGWGYERFLYSFLSQGKFF